MTRLADQAAADARQQDALARALAQQEFDRPLVVEAGAGTGKTATLVARILAWTLGPGWDRAQADLSDQTSRRATATEIAQATMRGVVAITFTDAAAAEMAERVGQGMLGVAQGRPPIGVVDSALPADTETRGTRAEQLLGALDLLEVRTIHAFCARLLQDHAVVAGLHPAFAVDADGQTREAVVREVVVDALVAGLGDPPDDDLLELATEGVGPDALVQAVTAFVEAAVDPDELLRDPLEDPATAQLCDALVRDLVAVTDALGGLADMRRSTRLKELWLALPPLVDGLGASPAFDQARDVALALAEGHATALTNLRRGKLGKAEAQALGPLDQVVLVGSRLAACIDFIAGLDPVATRRALRVVAPMVQQARRRLRGLGALAFGELLAEAAALLRHHPDICRRVRGGLRQLLVDEFQDTDPRQCEIVAALALDGDARSRPGLFIVGDPKQSIYGWRSADLQAYEDFVTRVLAGGGQRVSLVVNFRSVPPILQAVEGALSPVMLAQAGRQPAFQRLEACAGLADQPGFSGLQGQRPVELWAAWAFDGTGDDRAAVARQRKPPARQVEAAAVAQDIARLAAQGVAWRQVAVLFRSGSDLPVLVQALRDVGVPYAVERDRSYFLRREVADAVALISVVLAPHDQVALVAWLRSAMVGVPDAALLPLWRAQLPDLVARLRGPKDPLLADLRARIDAARAEVDALRPRPPGIDRIGAWDLSLVSALEGLARLRAAYDEQAVDRFVAALVRQSLIEETEAARYQGPWRLANLDRLFRDLVEGLRSGGDVHVVLRHLREGLAGLRQAEEGRPQEAAQDAVQLMTIHKSKGLGFDHVYVVGLDKQGGRRSPPSIEVHDAGAWRLFGQPSPGLFAHLQRATQVASAEQVRLLYVAMTRAKQRLVLAGCWERCPAPTPPDQASSALELLGSWAAVPDDLGDRIDGLDPGRADWSHRGVRWFVPGRWADLQAAASDPTTGREPAPNLVPPERVQADARTIHAASAAARTRMARPWTQGPSAQAHLSLRQAVAQAADDATRAPGLGAAAERAARLGAQVEASRDRLVDPRQVARAAGTAVHRVLEQLQLAHPDPAAALAAAARDLEGQLSLAFPPDVARPAAARAQLLLDRIAQGGLLRRLVALGPAVIARELPLLLPPSPDQGPVGALVGSIDLVYRDPDDAGGGLVVADYKTDQVPDDQLDHWAARHAPQLHLYALALHQALDLPAAPRAELWFLDADRIVVVGPSAPRGRQP